MHAGCNCNLNYYPIKKRKIKFNTQTNSTYKNNVLRSWFFNFIRNWTTTCLSIAVSWTLKHVPTLSLKVSV